MPGVAVIGSGNYDLEIDTGYDWDAFTLDDNLKGELDNTNCPRWDFPIRARHGWNYRAHSQTRTREHWRPVHLRDDELHTE
jgi:hypothetical protein